MQTFFKNVGVVLGLMVVWSSLVCFGTLEGWWHKPLTKSNNPNDFFEQAISKIQSKKVGSVAMALIENEDIHEEYFFSVDGSINRNTSFQVASLSKWITAWGIMSLVERGKIDLDEPVNNYLTRWHIPDGKFSTDGVTVRHLLSHKAGLTDGLGYDGFPPGTSIQSLEESLTKAADGSPEANGEVKIGLEPGTKWKYSGGGYTLLQLIIEEVSGKSFQDYMKAVVFKNLEMKNSTFIWDDSKNNNLAKFYDEDVVVQPHMKYTALAATSLYTSLHDMESFIKAHFAGANNEPIGRGVIGKETINQIKEPHAYRMGAAIWGLGTMLYASNNQNDFIIGHDGKNNPAINTAVRLDPTTGDGIVILTMGSSTLATEIGSEWVFWKTGNIDSLLFLILLEPMLLWMVIGCLIILVLFLLLNAIKRRTRIFT